MAGKPAGNPAPSGTPDSSNIMAFKTVVNQAEQFVYGAAASYTLKP